ncbi:hypothetical protein HAX54_017305, partial [Datura stramonium]|nr:hypothetical protein [Datura stramonium]
GKGKEKRETGEMLLLFDRWLLVSSERNEIVMVVRGEEEEGRCRCGGFDRLFVGWNSGDGNGGGNEGEEGGAAVGFAGSYGGRGSGDEGQREDQSDERMRLNEKFGSGSGFKW